MANLLVGNEPETGGVEMALAGMRFSVEGGPARIAVAGADQIMKVDGVAIPPLTSVTVAAGQTVDIGACRTGQFGYLAIAGGLAVPPVLGSISLQARPELGGIDGRAIRADDRLPCHIEAPAGPDLAAPRAIEMAHGPIRVLLGPQDDHFTARGLETFLAAPYAVSQQSDRMGVRLTGAKIEHGPKGYNIVSDGIATGSIQVPGTGEPLILLADRQTTGGYPKIATVITADHARLAQLRPGSIVHFASVSRLDAVAALAAQRAALAAFRAALRQAGMGDGFDPAALLGANLIDGVVDAQA
jgi:biotin-dependent carboxylase-like uncharacterized protein